MSILVVVGVRDYDKHAVVNFLTGSAAGTFPHVCPMSTRVSFRCAPKGGTAGSQLCMYFASADPATQFYGVVAIRFSHPTL